MACFGMFNHPHVWQTAFSVARTGEFNNNTFCCVTLLKINAQGGWPSYESNSKIFQMEEKLKQYIHFQNLSPTFWQEKKKKFSTMLYKRAFFYLYFEPKFIKSVLQPNCAKLVHKIKNFPTSEMGTSPSHMPHPPLAARLTLIGTSCFDWHFELSPPTL